MNLFPNTFNDFPNSSPGERLIFQKLKAAPGGQDWTVLHSLELLHRQQGGQSEADFVVMIPGKGILVLEVKAVKTVAFGPTGWRLGQKFEARGPFVQAKEAMFAIKQYLDGHGLDTSDVPFVYAVWFTHISRAGLPRSIEWTEDQVLSSEDLKRDIVDVFSKTIDALAAQINRSFPVHRAPAHRLYPLAEALKPSFVAHQSPAERQRDTNEFLETALAQQIDTVRLVEDLSAVMLRGMAGTGKTFIAIRAAQRAHARNERVLFVCFNRLLSRFLRDKLQHYPLVRVSSLHALMLEIAEVEVPVDASDEWWRMQLPNLALGRVEEYARSNGFDTLVVDEAQDLGTTEYLLFLDQLMEGGFKKAKIFACGDFEHQGIYLSGQESLRNFEATIPQLQVLTSLRTNCRNTKQLGDYLVSALELDPAYESYRRSEEESEVMVKTTVSEAAIPGTTAVLLRDLLKKFKPDQIVVLSAQRSRLAEMMSGIGLPSVELQKSVAGRIRWGSVHEFKGLEAMAVLQVEFDTTNESIVEALYVGATRSLYDYVLVTSTQKLERIRKELNRVQ